MIREEAIEILADKVKPCLSGTDWNDAIDMAIKALEKEPVLDKIRAEIEQHRYGLVNDGLDIALNIIDKYKAESVTENGARQ